MMNDFTKEELIYIQETMIKIIEIYPETNFPYAIRDKIMSKFKKGDIGFSIETKIIECIMEPNVGGFEAVRNKINYYEPQKVFKTKNEAIKTMIKKLTGLIDE